MSYVVASCNIKQVFLDISKSRLKFSDFDVCNGCWKMKYVSKSGASPLFNFRQPLPLSRSHCRCPL